MTNIVKLILLERYWDIKIYLYDNKMNLDFW